MQLTLDIQFEPDLPKISIVAPYSLAGRLEVVHTYRLKFQAGEISKLTGLPLAEIRKLTTLLDKLTIDALAFAYGGKIAEGVAVRMAKLSQEEQAAIVIAAADGKITGPLVDRVLASQREQTIDALPDDLFLPGETFGWEASAPVATVTPIDDRAALAQQLLELLRGMSADQMRSLLVDLAADRQSIA